MAVSKKHDSFDKWTTDDVAKFLEGVNLGDHQQAFIDNKILGKHLPLLTKDDLKDLGLITLGDRLAMAKEVQSLRVREKMSKRKEKLAEEIEAWNGSCLSRVSQTCFGLFPWDPDRYILTSTNLRIKSYDVYRLCNIWRMTCCGGTWTSDNIALNRVIDVDLREYKVGVLCCVEDKAELHFQMAAGADADSETSRLQSRDILVEGEIGAKFQQQLRDAIEEYKMEVGLGGRID